VLRKSNKILTQTDHDSDYDKQRTNMGVRSGPRIPSESREEGGNLLIHGNVGDGQVFIDSSPSGHTITTSGNTTHSTAQSKFDGGSIYFDGTGDYLTIADHADFTFGTGDFTIDLWIYPTTIGSGGNKNYVGTNPNQYLTFGSNNSGGLLFYYGGGTWTSTPSATSNVVVNSAWQHVAVSRSGGTVYLFHNGVLITSRSQSASIDPPNIEIGAYGGGASDLFVGYMDEFRITKGTALWTKDFKPPSRRHVTRNLILSFDAMNAKSFAGEPTTNIITDGDCNDGAHPDNVSFGFEASVSIVDCPIDDTGFRPSPKAMKFSKTSSTNGRIFFGSGWPTLDSDSGAATHPYCMSAWFYIPTSSTGNGNSSVGGRPFFNTDNSANSATINSHRTYHVNDKGKWIKLVNEFYSKAGNHSHGLRVISDDPIGAIYYCTEVQVEKKDHATPFVDGSRAAANAWRDISGNGNHGTFSSVDLGAASEDIHFVRRGSIILPNPDTNPTTNFVPAGRGVVANTDRPASINFDGSDDLVTTSFGSGRNPYTSPMTFVAWVKSDTTTNNKMWLDHGSNGTNQRLYCALITADNPKPFGIQSSAWSLPSNADNSKWYHQALVMDSGTARGYYDGNEGGTKSYTSYTLPGNVRAGGRNTYIWDGQIACFAIYNTALSHADIKQIYNAQKNRFGL
jgi:hypothetical protein